jgi:redox-sensitive bicupin YhaK (pirin superfamily)
VAQQHAPLVLDPESDLHIIPDTSFARLDENDFGAPGLVAIESVGPYVELGQVGPFVTIHDSYMEPGLGIGHHPHRYHERLFYILEGEVGHDDALNHITGEMREGDLAQLTEGERGMLHKEWNQAPGVRTHIFILVYRPDVEPPPPVAAFAALRASERPVRDEGSAATTIELVGPKSGFRPYLDRLRLYTDTTIRQGGSVELTMGANEGLIVYPLEGQVTLSEDGNSSTLAGSGAVWPEGPAAMAVAWSEASERALRAEAIDGDARFIRIAFERRIDDLMLHQPYPRRV